MNKINLTGKKFGRLIVLSEAPNIGIRTRWNCICDCGNNCIIRTECLINGYTKSCGCLKKETIKRTKSLPIEVTSTRYLLSAYKNRAEKKNQEFLLTEKEFLGIISKPCAYCGESPNTNGHIDVRLKGFPHNGVDRIDSSIGYIKENCLPCCKKCNVSKGNLQLKDWLLWVKKINKYLFGEDK